MTRELLEPASESDIRPRFADVLRTGCVAAEAVATFRHNIAVSEAVQAALA